MTRQSRAKWLALATAVAVVMLSALFATLRNLPAHDAPAPAAERALAAPAPTASTIDESRRAAGRAAFERLNCGMCHAIAGRGNPASALDGVGARRDRAAMRDWTLGTGTAREQLPAGIANIKARAADDPDLDALVDYLLQLR
jgi:mono/diheme cytochrome c family protein